ncbi:MAG: Uma2 family endonuclease [Chitinophagales bacterium]
MHTLTLKTDMLDDRLGSDLFFQFCVQHRDLRIERNPNKEIIIMAPTGSETGNYNSEVNADLVLWNRKYKLGYTFDSSAGFTLPNGAVRSPDVSWIKKEKWEAISEADRKIFAPICPDFVIEIRSKTDVLKTLKEKMKEYILNGTRLAWLLDMKNEEVYMYRPDLKEDETEVADIKEEVCGFDVKISGGDVLPKFELDLSDF